MKKQKFIYFRYDDQEESFLTSGISFSDYIQHCAYPPEHMLLIKADCFGNGREFCFELVEGKQALSDFIREKEYVPGDFCFVDYDAADSVSGLTDQEIAELLFLGHMGRPMHTPFFQKLHNQMAYLSHDDGWWSRLYVRNPMEPVGVLQEMLFAVAGVKASGEAEKEFREKLFTSAKEGILIDLEEAAKAGRTRRFLLYAIGAFTDMDEIGNHMAKRKQEASHVFSLDIGSSAG